MSQLAFAFYLKVTFFWTLTATWKHILLKDGPWFSLSQTSTPESKERWLLTDKMRDIGIQKNACEEAANFETGVCVLYVGMHDCLQLQACVCTVHTHLKQLHPAHNSISVSEVHTGLAIGRVSLACLSSLSHPNTHFRGRQDIMAKLIGS